MSVSTRRAAAISGWLVAMAIAGVHLAGRYDVLIQERSTPSIDTRGAPVAVALNLPLNRVGAGHEETLVAAAQGTTGPEIPAADRRLAAAEQDLPSDYRFTYERAKLAVYGRADHHEAFHHLKRAAEKAIQTERAEEMLDRLRADGAAQGPLRKLAVGHSEWARVHEALEHGDARRLWQVRMSARHHAAPRTETVSSDERSEDPHSARSIVYSLLRSGRPCQALVVLRQVRDTPESEQLYHSVRETCLR